MANIKSYKLEINGITESIDAVNSLMKQLNALEARIKEINSLGVKVDKINVGAVDESAAANALRVQKEINKLKEEGLKLDAKIAAAQDEVYKKVDATKELYKKTIADQKGIAAQERLVANEYTNTMQGMKQHLADLKSVINTTDLGDGDQIKKMTQEANELNDKLKEIEKSYGQFGRNVGNYPDLGKNLQAIVVSIGGVEREFSNAREATRTLNNELKAMAVNGQQNTKAYDELRQKLLELESTLNDAKRPMDNILDTMESFTAIASVSKGFGAFFGIDQTEIQKSMQQLLGLQTALKGLQTIAKQVETREGVGKWIAPFITNINAAEKRLLVFNRALLGTGTAAKVAATGIKTFSKVLKGAISLGVLVLVEQLVEGFTKLIESFKKTGNEAEKLKGVLNEQSKAYVNATTAITKANIAINNFNGTQKEEKKLVESLNSQFGTSLGTYKSLAKWKEVLKTKTDAYVESLMIEAQITAKVNQLVEQYEKLNELKANKGNFSTWLNKNTFGLLGKSYSEAFNELRQGAQQIEDEITGLVKDLNDNNEANKLFDFSPQIEKNNKKNKDAVKEAEKELARERISLMKEGLNKTITQLEEERKQRLAKLDKNTKNYKEYEKQINDIYDLKILNAREEWAKKLQELNRKMWANIASDTEANLKMIADRVKNSSENARKKLEENYFSNVAGKNRVFSYGVQATNQLTPMTRFSLGVEASDNQSKKMTEMKKVVDLWREMSIAFNEYQVAEQQYKRNQLVDTKKLTRAQKEEFLAEKNLMAEDKARTKEIYDEKKKIYEDYVNELKKTYIQADILDSTNKLKEESYSKDLKTIFNQRYSMVERYWQGRVTLETEEAEKNYKAQIDLLNQQEILENAQNDENFRERLQQAKENNRLIIDEIKTAGEKEISTKEEVHKRLEEEEKRYEKDIEDIKQNYKTRSEEIEKKYNLDNIRLQKEREDAVKNVISNAYQDRLQELRDFQTAVSTLESKQPVINEWGITNFKETNKINKNLLSSYEAMARKVIELKKEVAAEIKDKSLADSILRELDNFTADLGNKMDDVKRKLSVGEQIGQFISDIQQYVQALGQGLQEIMTAVWDAQDTQFDNESRQLDKLNEKLQDAMDENEAILQKHQQTVNDIESELQSARGARREHLIDQLNAEVEAERRAAAEKKKIEKQQEALQKKQDDLDKKRTMAQYQRELAQILVSGALAAVNAYASKPFVPVGLAMGSLSLGLTAAQYAIAKANPPKFANGGLLEGKSHAQGGIRAGGVELEGNEYVVNKHTTMQNIDLLEYINSNRKKLNISDLIEFYQGDKPRKAIQGVRTRFADGGVLPQMRTDLDVTGGLINAFEQYSNRPVVVDVREITSKQESITRVKTLAGLS